MQNKNMALVEKKGKNSGKYKVIYKVKGFDKRTKKLPFFRPLVKRG